MASGVKHVVIIGGSGALGQHLARYLQCDPCNQILILDQNPPNVDLLRKKNIHYYKVDILADSIELMEQYFAFADVVFFKIGLLGDPNKSSDFGWARDYININAYSLLRIAPLMVRAGVKRLIVDSSITAISNFSIDQLMEETLLPSVPTNFYGLSKAILEDICRYNTHLLRLDPIIIRYPRVYIPGHINFITNFVRQMKTNGRIQILGNPDKTIDLVHVADATRVAARCINYSGKLRTFHAAYGRALTLAQIAKMVADYNQKTAEITSASSELIPAEPRRAQLASERTIAELSLEYAYTPEKLVISAIEDHHASCI